MQNISKANQRCRTSILVANKKSTKRWHNQEQLDFPICFVLTLLCAVFLNAMCEKCNLLNIFQCMVCKLLSWFLEMGWALCSTLQLFISSQVFPGDFVSDTAYLTNSDSRVSMSWWHSKIFFTTWCLIRINKEG